MPIASAAQPASGLEGHVFDATGAVVPGALLTVRDAATGVTAAARTAADGRYRFVAMPEGTYSVTLAAPGFRTAIVPMLRLDSGRIVVRDFVLAVGDARESVLVRGDAPLADRDVAAAGHRLTNPVVQGMPLNGRHFIDLGLLVPGAVATSQTAFSARPIRGVGALALNLAGSREEAVAFIVNGVSTNNLTFGSLIFEPPLASIEELAVDTSAFGAEHGHVSGAIVSIVTTPGTDQFRAEAFEFVRNDALDARNFFESSARDPAPFRRHQFGAAMGGPIRRGRAFFFASYEGFRQRQGIEINTVVLSDEERRAATDAVTRRLIDLVPRANVVDAGGTARYVGWTPAIVDRDRWTIDLRHRLGDKDRIQAFYGASQVRSTEPAAQGNNLPGFGQASQPFTSVLTVSHERLMGATLNELRFGRSRLRGGTFPATQLNPADFGIANGVTEPIGLPQLAVAGALNFGGPGPLPQGRYDTSYVLSDTFSRTSGRHSILSGAEYRHFVNENFAQGTGVFNFPSVAAFIAGTANAFSITLGNRGSVIDQRAVALFARDRIRAADRLTIELGLRYEWHVSPTEREDKFVVFDAATASFQRVGIDVPRIYRQNDRNLEPRLGLSWSVTEGGRTVLRAEYGRAVDQPGTTAVRDTAGNPPFATPLSATGAIPLASAIEVARPVGLSPATVDPRFRNAALDAWNIALQHQLGDHMAATMRYAGSRGRDLRISRNINQPVAGIRPFPAVAHASPILPGVPLGNIVQVESSGFSNYHGASVGLTRRLAHGLQFEASYTWSKSLDTNSLNSSGFAVQDSNDIANQYGLSDFDARHRVVVSASFASPATGPALTRNWQLTTLVQAQSGNPVNIVTSDGSINGMVNTVRPDVTGPIHMVGSVDRWFDPSSFAAVNRFGNLGRNVVIGPGFQTTDVSLTRRVTLGRVALELRADVFNVFNHANFGPPGNVVGSPTFGRISRTRLPAGEAGSSRQVQLALKLWC